jgi:hypothetical protein
MDDHWCFRLRSLAHIHFAEIVADLENVAIRQHLKVVSLGNVSVSSVDTFDW